MNRLNKLASVVRREKAISKVQLILASGISISYYDKLKPFLEELYQDIHYDRMDRLWKADVVEEINSI